MAKAAKTYADEFRAIFERQCAYYGYKTRMQQSKALGIPRSTLYKYLNDLDMIPLPLLRRIYRVLRFEKDERDLINHTGRMNV